MLRTLLKLPVLAPVLVVALVLVGYLATRKPPPKDQLDWTAPAERGFTLPPGFESTLFHAGVAQQRHIAVSSEGVVFVIRRHRVEGTGLLAIKDRDGDGVADVTEHFGRFSGSGIGVRTDAAGQEWLYASSRTAVWRWALQAGEVAPSAEPERVARGFPRQPEHPYKALAFDREGGMYVNVGAPSNNCMERRRTKGSPGQQPCPQLARAAGVWKFDADALNQHQNEAERYATGIRNMIAFTWSDTHKALFGVQHGRDFFNRYFPELFSPQDAAELPSEEFHRIDRGDNMGWPYSYYDHIAGERRISPEYEAEGTPNRGRNRTDEHEAPLIGFPGHWAPSDIVFYEATEGDFLFPERYHGGALLVFKGGWGRNPHPPQQGFQVVFVPMENGAPAGETEVFAGGFEGPEPPISLGDALYLPFSAAIGPEGELFLADTKDGVMWRIVYTGEERAEAATPTATDANTTRAPDPARIAARQRRLAAAERYPIGADLYARECATCHQADGRGVEGFAPAVEGSAILAAPAETLISYTLLGANSGRYSNIMPAYLNEPINDYEMAALLSYARLAFAAPDATGPDAAEPNTVEPRIAEADTADRADLDPAHQIWPHEVAAVRAQLTDASE